MTVEFRHRAACIDRPLSISLPFFPFFIIYIFVHTHAPVLASFHSFHSFVDWIVGSFRFLSLTTKNVCIPIRLSFYHSRQNNLCWPFVTFSSGNIVALEMKLINVNEMNDSGCVALSTTFFKFYVSECIKCVPFRALSKCSDASCAILPVIWHLTWNFKIFLPFNLHFLFT